MALQTLEKDQVTDVASVVSPKSNWRLTRKDVAYLAAFTGIFGAACFLIFTNLGNFPLFNPDEALYAEPAREMLEKNEWITTLLNYAVRFTKPPLVIWAMAGCYKLFGVTEFAARYFGAACGATLIGVTYLFARAHLNARAAMIAGFALMTAPMFLGTSREAITDIPLSLFMTGSLMCFYHSYATAKANEAAQSIKQFPWLLLVGYTAIGLAIMTKGPVGIILPVAILGTFHILRWNVLSALKHYKPWFGLPLVALIAVPWFAIEISITKGAYYREFILRENVQRFTGVVDHKAAWWYHIAAMFGGFFPWTAFLPGAIAATFFTRAESIKAYFKRFQTMDKQQSVMVFAALTSAIVLGFFSAGVSKLIPYTLPAFPMLAVLVGGYADKLWTESKFKTVSSIFAFLSVVFAGALAAIPILGARLHDCPQALLKVVAIFLVIQAGACITTAILAAKKQLPAAALTFIIAMFCTLWYAGNQGVNAVSNQWENPIQSYAEFAGASKATILVYQMRKPSVTFYAKRRFLLPKSPNELKYILSKTDRAYIISRSRSEKDIKAIPGSKHLCQMGQYVLVSYIRPGAGKIASIDESANAKLTAPDKETASDE